MKDRFLWWIKNWRNEICYKIAHILPKRVVYWAAIRVAVFATTGIYSGHNVPRLTFMEAVKIWGQEINT